MESLQCAPRHGSPLSFGHGVRLPRILNHGTHGNTRNEVSGDKCSNIADEGMHDSFSGFRVFRVFRGWTLFADMNRSVAEPAGSRHRRAGAQFQIEDPWLGVPEPGRSAVAFSQVSMRHLFPIFYPTSFTALPGIGAAPTKGIQVGAE